MRQLWGYFLKDGKTILLIIFQKTQEKEVHRPGLEPEFRRWQRLVITTTLSMLELQRVALITMLYKY